ncbi:hypothetical protein [Bdellovibrio svalbardensis]|uniref:Lipoprotein n=1 Tax=Bdellovibrio svalbardensis TaxID=2972972 RepID=A0ABT6DJ61_9BACT|nr:hypothetical protein [Bdellovibrio svalbardensis]MDG0815118.1 hypothetical protein [Bdellovibrio svalbardensis]
MNPKTLNFKALMTFIIVMSAVGCSFRKSGEVNQESPIEVKKIANEDDIQAVLESKIGKKDLVGALNYALYNELSLRYIIKEKDKSLIEIAESFSVEELSKSSVVSLLQSIQKKNPVKILDQRSMLVVAAKSMDRSFFQETVQSLSEEVKVTKVDHEELSSALEEIALESENNSTFGEVIEDSRLSQRFEWIKFKTETLGSLNLISKMNISVKVLNSYLYSNYIKQNPSKSLELVKALDSAKIAWDLTHSEQLSVFTTIYAVGLPGNTTKELTLFFLSKNRSAAEILTSECDLSTPYLLDPVIASFKVGHDDEGILAMRDLRAAMKGSKNYCQNGIKYIVGNVTDDAIAARLIKSYVQIEGLPTEEFIKTLQFESKAKKRPNLVSKVRSLIPEEQRSQFDLYVQIASGDKAE